MCASSGALSRHGRLRPRAPNLNEQEPIGAVSREAASAVRRPHIDPRVRDLHERHELETGQYRRGPRVSVDATPFGVLVSSMPRCDPSRREPSPAAGNSRRRDRASLPQLFRGHPVRNAIAVEDIAVRSHGDPVPWKHVTEEPRARRTGEAPVVASTPGRDPGDARHGAEEHSSRAQDPWAWKIAERVSKISWSVWARMKQSKASAGMRRPQPDRPRSWRCGSWDRRRGRPVARHRSRTGACIASS